MQYVKNNFAFKHKKWEALVAKKYVTWKLRKSTQI